MVEEIILFLTKFCKILASSSFGISYLLAISFDVDKTPGTPAPGWVLAPTKYKPFVSFALFPYLKYADWVNIGWIPKPLPA